jgi:tetrahydromethanopterin S-methyltransferase subunit G
MDDKTFKLITDRLDRIEDKVDCVDRKVNKVDKEIVGLKGKVAMIASSIGAGISSTAIATWHWVTGGGNL